MRPRFLVALAVIPVRLPSRDDADVAIAFSEDELNYLAVVFARCDEAPLAVIVPCVLGDQDIAAEYFRSLAEADAMFAPIGRILSLISLEAHAM